MSGLSGPLNPKSNFFYKIQFNNFEYFFILGFNGPLKTRNSEDVLPIRKLLRYFFYLIHLILTFLNYLTISQLCVNLAANDFNKKIAFINLFNTRSRLWQKLKKKESKSKKWVFIWKLYFVKNNYAYKMYPIYVCM